MIEVRDLKKSYGHKTVVDGVSFSVEQGEIFGILGPNGAGKTTSVECIGGLRKRDGGSIVCIGSARLMPSLYRTRLSARPELIRIYRIAGQRDSAVTTP